MDLLLAVELAEVARRRGLHLDVDACVHRPARADCPLCLEVAARLLVDEADDLHAAV
jgi:hypothetical protein